MAAYPGFYAVPGSMWPGAAWPGEVIPAAAPATGPAAVFAAGSPYFQWETQEPYLS